MISTCPTRRRCAALGIATVGAALSLASSPSYGQGNRPIVTHSHPVVRTDRRHTRISMQFSMPTGYRLAERPWFRIVRQNDRPFLRPRPMFENRGPEWRASLDLNTEDFPPGTYRMRAEVACFDAMGRREVVTSNWAPLIVPRRR